MIGLADHVVAVEQAALQRALAVADAGVRALEQIVERVLGVPERVLEMIGALDDRVGDLVRAARIDRHAREAVHVRLRVLRDGLELLDDRLRALLRGTLQIDAARILAGVVRERELELIVIVVRARLECGRQAVALRADVRRGRVDRGGVAGISGLLRLRRLRLRFFMRLRLGGGRGHRGHRDTGHSATSGGGGRAGGIRARVRGGFGGRVGLLLRLLRLNFGVQLREERLRERLLLGELLLELCDVGREIVDVGDVLVALADRVGGRLRFLRRVGAELDRGLLRLACRRAGTGRDAVRGRLLP
ncbi:MAG TPA: hypothetical protein VGG74_03975, partial [Kofleriaceae bacterium]